MTWLAQLISWLNGGMNVLFRGLRALMQSMPAWLSLTIISALLGVVLLILFKYTSPQTAIGRVRDRIKANLLAMKLFKDSVPAVLKAQGKVIAAAFMLLVYSVPPVLVMMLPFCLILGQLGVWYQAAPLEPGNDVEVVMQLSGSVDDPLPQVSLVPTDVAQTIVGPVRVPAEQRIYWKLRTNESGIYNLQFKVGENLVSKQLAVGSGLMPVSMKRPSLNVEDVILYPAERPFDESSTVQSIKLSYPDRPGLLTGSGNWIITLFVVSMLAALAVKPVFRVKI